MYLKRIELTGFKSFAEKTELHFKPGIIAIVGPNGCGKSNVVDAIQWCLGEQSTRSLRCQNMIDVLFNGSQKRSPMGMAEVSLVFDNSTNKIPLDFNEITITRKLFRSSESEYFINKVQCRMKDIRDLFLDTGIGYEGYSIMEQGRVEFILNAKPEERREMFEEAAGVSKYKARRDEALRKMERIQIDLNRIQDTIELVKEQIRQLDLAARKTKQYKTSLEELKTIEISDFLFQLNSANDEIKNIEQKRTLLQDNLHAITAQLDSQEVRLESMRVALTEKEKQFSEIQSEAYKIDSEITVGETRAENAHRRITELKMRKEKLASDIQQGAAELDQMMGLYQTLVHEVSELEQQKNQLESTLNEKQEGFTRSLRLREEKKNNTQTIREKLLQKEQELTVVNNELFEVSSKVSRTTGEQFTREKEYARSSERSEVIQQEVIEAQKKNDESRIILDTLQSEKLSLQKTLRELDEQLNGHQTSDENINQQQLKICARLSALTEKLEHDPYYAGSQCILEHSWKGIYGPLHRLIQYADEYRLLVADGLGNYMNYFVSETIAEAEEALQYLKENNKGRARFLVLETLPQSIPEPMNFITLEKPLLSVIQYDPRIKSVLHVLIASTYFKDSFVYRDYTIEGGADYSTAQYVVGTGTLQEKDTLEKELQSKTQERKKCIEQKTIIEKEIERFNADIEVLNQKIRQQELTHSINERKMQELLQNVSQADEEMKVINCELSGYTALRQNLNNDIQVLSQKRLHIENEIQHNRALSVEYENELSKMASACDCMAEEINQLKITHSQIAERLNHKYRERERLIHDHSNGAQTHVMHNQEYQESEFNIQEQNDIHTHQKSLIDELFKRKETHDVLVKKSAEEKNALQHEIHQYMNHVHDLRQQASAAREETHAVEMGYQKLMMQITALTQNLKEKYQLNVEEALRDYQPLPIETDRAQKLKNRIDSFGAVNLAAPEEYAQLEGRYEFLQKQYQDILNAKEDLQRVIQKINSTTKENFITTFQQVQEHFKKIYGILFHGGEAELRLTQEDNLLETGVDIFAQPPGKRLQNISLLSGGERALTAAALLFAFFMVKPSPICVLDEVDAPLDESNIRRFVRMIKDFSNNIQFLMITHNKRTMEAADTLYGVTMEEYGVSKLISISFAKSEELSELQSASLSAPLVNQ